MRERERGRETERERELEGEAGAAGSRGALSVSLCMLKQVAGNDHLVATSGPCGQEQPAFGTNAHTQ